jgi:hypothetical protein
MISKQLLGCKISAGSVSRANKELVEAVERWRTGGFISGEDQVLAGRGEFFDAGGE